MSRTARRRLAAGISLALLVAIVLVARPLVAYALVLSRSTAGFVPSATDERVLFEPGAEAEAAQVAAALPAAVARVEQVLGGPFVRPVAVHVCATLASFDRFTDGDRAAGTTLGGRLFLSPKLAATPERVPKVLAHELTHLYFQSGASPLRSRWSLPPEFQRGEGIYAWRRSFPPWLGEGLAVWVSEGGGAEGVGEAEAAQAIREGRSFVPTAPGVFARSETASSFGLDAHLFYRQSGMFVGYLHDRDPEAFRRMLARLAAGEPLAGAFPAAFGVELDTAWADFVRGLRAR